MTETVDRRKAMVAVAGGVAGAVTLPFPAQADSNGWQPIETAPKDGSRILILKGKKVSIGFWHDLKEVRWGEVTDRSRWYFDDWEINSERKLTPTHWHPMPPAPESV